MKIFKLICKVFVEECVNERIEREEQGAAAAEVRKIKLQVKEVE